MECTHKLEKPAPDSQAVRSNASVSQGPLIKDSPILLLDEATSALDTQSEIEVQKGLESLREGRNMFLLWHIDFQP